MAKFGKVSAGQFVARVHSSSLSTRRYILAPLVTIYQHAQAAAKGWSRRCTATLNRIRQAVNAGAGDGALWRALFVSDPG